MIPTSHKLCTTSAELLSYKQPVNLNNPTESRMMPQPRTTPTLDLLTYKVDRFMPPPRGPPALIDKRRFIHFRKIVPTSLATDKQTNKQTDGWKHRQENIVPPPAASLDWWRLVQLKWLTAEWVEEQWLDIYADQSINQSIRNQNESEMVRLDEADRSQSSHSVVTS